MAGTVITVAQQKGGAGKTTLAAHLAVAWGNAGRRVALLDIDPQGSLSAWYRLREERLGNGKAGIDLAAITAWRVVGEAERRARDCDIVLIDGPPHANNDAKASVRAAKRVVVPVQPSPMDVWATRPTLELAREAKVPVLLVLNRVPPRARLTEAMLDKIGELGVAVAEARIGSRVALANALFEGRGITEAAPSSPAAAEIGALAEEISRRLRV
jgi:chromosome partitioning protein